MQPIKEMEIGVMFWVDKQPEVTLWELKALGVRCGQLGVAGQVDLDRENTAWKAVLNAEQFVLTTLFCGYNGESYEDYPTIERTVGFVPSATRKERLARTLAVSNFAADLGVPAIACHLGFIPDDPKNPNYAALCEIVGKVCYHAATHGQIFALETGQERADVLLRFIKDCSRSNLKVNFDPANMVLYGTQNPIVALRAVAPLVVSVHCKDGNWPAAPGTLGSEAPLGEGSVDIRQLVSTLREVGYRGALHIERETPDPVQRLRDIRMAVGLLREILA